MTGFEAAKWKMRKLFPGSWSRPNSDSVRAEADTAVVRLIDPPRRLPATPIEQRLITTLKKAGPVSFAKLVKNLSGDLYAEELRKGAGVLDIGLFGSRLFNDDVARELKAANGTLWEIKSKP
jgi:hypothetical protein